MQDERMDPVSVVEGGISANPDGTINFGNHLAAEKIKVNNFEAGGHIYSVKTHKEVTRLEQNGKMLLECVPGAAFWNFRISGEEISFVLKGNGIVNMTFELAAGRNYMFYIGGKKIGEQKLGISGKVSFSADTGPEHSDQGIDIKITAND